MPADNSHSTAAPLNSTPKTTGRLRAWADTLLVLLVFLVVGGDLAPGVNEAHYLTRLKHWWNPQWIGPDLFLDSPDAHLTVVLLFGWLTLWLPLTAVAWIGRLVSWAVLAWAWRRLCWRLVPTMGVASLAAALWCVAVRQGHLAGEWVVGGFEAKSLAWAFVIAALGSCCGGQWNRAWVELGVASALHVLVGGWSVVLLAVVWSIHYRQQVSLPAMTPGLAIGGLFALAGIVPPLVMNAGTSPEVASEAALIYVFERLPHHLAPLSMGGEWWWLRGSSHLVMLLLLGIAMRWARKTELKQARCLCSYAWGAVALSVAGLLIELMATIAPDRSAALLRFYWFRTADIAVPLAVSLAFVTWLVRAMQQQPVLAKRSFVAALLLIAWYQVPVVGSRLQSDRPPADKSVRDYHAWIDVCQWAATHTDDDALFLTPRGSHTFHWRAERAEVVVRKNIPQDAAGLLEWYRRMREVHQPPNTPPDALKPWTLTPGSLGARRLKWLAGKYGIDYVLSDHRRPVSLPVAYRNRAYTVYDLRDAKHP